MKSLVCCLLLGVVSAAAMGQTPLLQGPQGALPSPSGAAQGNYGLPLAQMPSAYAPPPVHMPGAYGQATVQSPTPYDRTLAQTPVPQTFALPAAAPSCCSQNCGCCEPVRKVCVCEPATKTVTHVCYSKTCEEFCVPKCSCCPCLSWFCGSCLQCEGPYARYYLVKKVSKEERPIAKCVPAVAPPCGNCAIPPSR
jgi:hypothetical protein